VPNGPAYKQSNKTDKLYCTRTRGLGTGEEFTAGEDDDAVVGTEVDTAASVGLGSGRRGRGD